MSPQAITHRGAYRCSILYHHVLTLVDFRSPHLYHPNAHANYPHVAHASRPFQLHSGIPDNHIFLWAPPPRPTQLTSLGQNSTSIGEENDPRLYRVWSGLKAFTCGQESPIMDTSLPWCGCSAYMVEKKDKSYSALTRITSHLD
jgi:hypothetical protein